MGIQRYLYRKELYGKQLRRNHFHKSCHIVVRFNFAKTFLNKEYCFQEQVLWSDGIKIEFFRHNDIIQKIWYEKSEVSPQKTQSQH